VPGVSCFVAQSDDAVVTDSKPASSVQATVGLCRSVVSCTFCVERLAATDYERVVPHRFPAYESWMVDVSSDIRLRMPVHYSYSATSSSKGMAEL